MSTSNWSSSLTGSRDTAQPAKRPGESLRCRWAWTPTIPGRSDDRVPRPMIRKGFSDNTINAFQADLRLFTKYMAANRTLGAVSQGNLEQFLVWMSRPWRAVQPQIVPRAG